MIETSIESLSLAEREKQVIFQTYERLPIGEVVSATGSYITTADGKKYLDAIAGLGVNALGHSDQMLVAAIQHQAEQYLHLSNLYLQAPQVRLAELLTDMTGWEKVFFTNSGTEAVEGALKLARKFFCTEDKTDIIGFHNGFHGRTYGPLSVMDTQKYRNGFGPFIPNAHAVDPTTLADRISSATAAVIVEVIQGEGGICELPASGIDKLHALQKEFGFLIIADEIQSGVGRTGSFFSYEQVGLKPDIVVCAKAIGGGLPLGTILTRNEIAAALTPGSHGTTFGGNALACSAGIVVLERLRGGLLTYVQEVSENFHAQLHALRAQYPTVIRDIRGKGLMIGIGMHTSAKMAAEMLLAQHQIIVNVTANDVIRLLPPLVWTETEVALFLTAFEATVKTISQMIN